MIDEHDMHLAYLRATRNAILRAMRRCDFDAMREMQEEIRSVEANVGDMPPISSKPSRET